MNAMVIQARREHRQKQAACRCQIQWHHVDLAWSIDGSELAFDPNSRKLVMYNVQDLGSQYKLPAVAGPMVSLKL